MRRDRRRDDDRLDGVVSEHVVEAPSHARVRMPLREFGAPLLVDVAEPRELREVVEVTDEVLSPLAEAYVGEASHGHSFQTFPLPVPFLPVALRRSTTICARPTRSS